MIALSAVTGALLLLSFLADREKTKKGLGIAVKNR